MSFASAETARRLAAWVLVALGLAGAIPAARAAEVDIRIEGNRFLSTEELRREAARELERLRPPALRLADVDDAAFQMERRYRREGYAFVEIEFAIEEGESRVVFRIREGPRLRVGPVSFHGNEALSRQRLLELAEAERPGIGEPGRVPYVRAEIEAIAEALRAAYLEEGFRDAVVEVPPAPFSEEDGLADLRFRIHEGPRWIVEALEPAGPLPPETSADFEALKGETVGRPHTARTRAELAARLTAICTEAGYPDATAHVTEIRAAPGRVRLEVSVQTGPQVRLAGIEIRGVERTRVQTVRSRIALREGDLYRRSLAEETLRELYRLGIFRSVRLELEESGEAGRRILAVTVEEAEGRQVFLEPGWGSYERLRLSAGVRDTNLLGTARPAALEGTVSLPAQRLGASLADPRFLGTRWRSDFGLSGWRRREPSFTRTEAELGLSFSYPLTPELTVTAGSALRRTKLSDLSDPGGEPQGRGAYDTASLRAQLAWDTRDDWFFPRRGLASFAAVEHSDAHLGSEVTFTRLTAGSRLFLSVAADTVLALRARTGFLLPGPKEEGLPVAERFFNGGENSVRSFRESELGPRDASGEPAGGYAATTLSAELRRALVGKLSGSLFADWGNVAPNRSRTDEGRPPYRSRREVVRDTARDFFGGFRPAVGAGLQLLLPVGPVRLDLAFNPDRDPRRDEERAVVHFSVGMAF